MPSANRSRSHRFRYVVDDHSGPDCNHHGRHAHPEPRAADCFGERLDGVGESLGERRRLRGGPRERRAGGVAGELENTLGGHVGALDLRDDLPLRVDRGHVRELDLELPELGDLEELVLVLAGDGPHDVLLLLQHLVGADEDVASALVSPGVPHGGDAWWLGLAVVASAEPRQHERRAERLRVWIEHVEGGLVDAGRALLPCRGALEERVQVAPERYVCGDKRLPLSPVREEVTRPRVTEVAHAEAAVHDGAATVEDDLVHFPARYQTPPMRTRTPTGIQNVGHPAVSIRFVWFRLAAMAFW